MLSNEEFDKAQDEAIGVELRHKYRNDFHINIQTSDRRFGGTNKKPVQFHYNSHDFMAVEVLNEKDNKANGIKAKDAKRIVAFYQVVEHFLSGHFSISKKNKKLLGLDESEIAEINEKTKCYTENQPEFNKIRNPEGAKFGIAKIWNFWTMKAKDRSGGISKKLLYVCSLINGEELKPDKNGVFDTQKSIDQASSYSSLTIFIDSFFSPETLKKVFGSKLGEEIFDPYHPAILKNKADEILGNEDYLYNLGAGVKLNLEGYEASKMPKNFSNKRKLHQEKIITEKVAEIKNIDSKKELVEIGRSHAELLSKKIDTLTEYYKELSEICTVGFVHGDTWHDNQKKNSAGEHIIFDLEEAGCGLHILDVGTQISNKGGIDEKTGKLNKLGKAIFEAAEKNFNAAGKSLFNEGLNLSAAQKEEAVLKAAAITSTYIEIMRAFKYADGLHTKRNPFEQSIVSEIAIDGVGEKNTPSGKFITFSQLKRAFSLGLLDSNSRIK